MKKVAIFIENFKSTYGIVSRVEGLQDYIYGYVGYSIGESDPKSAPFNVSYTNSNGYDVLNNDPCGALITYESRGDYFDDARCEDLINDLNDPMFKEDTRVLVITDESSEAEIKEFKDFVTPKVDEVSMESLMLVGFKEFGEIKKSTTDLNPLDLANYGMESVDGVDDETPEPLVQEVTDVPEPATDEVEEVQEDLPEVNEVIEDEEEVVVDIDPETIKVPEEIAQADEVKEIKEAIKEEGISDGVKFVNELFDSFKDIFKESGVPSPREFAEALAWVRLLKNKDNDHILSTESIQPEQLTAFYKRRYPLNFYKLGIITTQQVKDFYRNLTQDSIESYVDIGSENLKFLNNVGAKYVGWKFGLVAFITPDGEIGFIDNDLDNGKFDRTSTIEADLEEENLSVKDIMTEEDYNYMNAVPYVERVPESEVQEILSLEADNSIVVERDASAKPYEFSLTDDIVEGISNLFSKKPQTRIVMTVKEVEAFMRWVTRMGVSIKKELDKNVFKGVYSGYRKMFIPAKDACINYQRPPVAVTTATRGLIIPILEYKLRGNEISEFFNSNITNDFYWTVLNKILRDKLLDMNLLSRTSLTLGSFAQDPLHRYVFVWIETGIKIVTPAEKEALGNSANTSITVESIQPEVPQVEENKDGDTVSDDFFNSLVNEEDKEETVEKPEENQTISTEDAITQTLTDLGIDVPEHTLPHIDKEKAEKLFDELSMESDSDDDLFEKILKHRSELGEEYVDLAINFNALRFNKTGVKLKNNPFVISRRRKRVLAD